MLSTQDGMKHPEKKSCPKITLLGQRWGRVLPLTTGGTTRWISQHETMNRSLQRQGATENRIIRVCPEQ